MSATDPLVQVRMVSVGDYGAAVWAEGVRFKVPADLPARLGWRVLTSGDVSIDRGAPPVPPGEIPKLRERAAFTEQPPLSARLPISYQRVPGRVRALIGSAIGRRHRGRADRWADFPQWPLDLSADLLFDLSLPVAPYPPSPAKVILTHDIDSSEGLRNLVRCFLPAEEGVGARSTNFIVPCAWPIDEALASEVTARGHEVGVHG